MVRGVILYLVLPNVAFFLIGSEFFINRALFNSDYLLLWVGSCYLPRRTTIILYTGMVCLDLILSTETIYHFSTVETIEMAGEYFKYYPAPFYVAAGGLLMLAIAEFAKIWRRDGVRPPLSKRGQLLIGTVALTLSGVTLARSSDPFDSYLETYGESSIVTSGVIEIGLASLRIATASHRDQNTMPARVESTSRMVRELSHQGKSASPYNIVLILVESQGLLNSARDMRRVLAPLIDPAIKARYDVNTGAVRFYGSTVYGEMRVLCRIYVLQAIPPDLSRRDRCLPNVLRRLGYDTLSYHGYHQWFYERFQWYPALGFQRSFFAEELEELTPPMCGTIVYGICDLWIADQVEHELLTPGRERKEFIYWLTLNSHYPIDLALASKSTFDCASTETLQEKTGPCALARIHYQLYTRIAQMALNSQLPPTRFIVVGDHVPPFTTLSERALYDNDQVPFVELIPRSVPQSLLISADQVIK